MTIDSGGAVLELVDVHKRYGVVQALSGLNLRLERGSVYGFIGRNGAGKSTTLRIIMGITIPDRGQVSLFGSLTRRGDVAPRRRIGYVAQEQHFYEWMTPKRLGSFVGAFYPSWDATRFEGLLRSFDVPARKVSTLSGGNKVKLALALALAHRPELLVLDEPTVGLDAVSRREFLDIVRELMQSGEHAALFSSHLIDEVEALATRVGIIEQGRMRYEGSLADLATRVRCLVLEASVIGQLLQVTGTGSAADAVRAALAGLPIRVLKLRNTGADVELVLWLDEPGVIDEAERRLLAVKTRTLSLEDCFIEIVSEGSRLPVEHESPTAVLP
ncbi:MAG: ABC transporter ATP-binding protein [Myxococcota bacterium]